MQRALLWIGAVMVGLLAFVEPVLAQNMTQDQACNNPLITTVNNGMVFLTAAGPTVGSANAGYNMMKAAGTNKSGKKKEYKENIRSSLMYGFGLGMLTGIVALITSFGPMSTC
ncbi:hypothetical protein ACFR9U_13785 [Halorientalis brevis]|uniref:DUF4134 domain-containing protein n=2 Tax=Halorientalis brevis TaxID=1126241 RepID=A0ABD6CD01_9EURY